MLEWNVTMYEEDLHDGDPDARINYLAREKQIQEGTNSYLFDTLCSGQCAGDNGEELLSWVHTYILED